MIETLINPIKNIDIKPREYHFKPGNKETGKRKYNNGGRLPAIITSVRQELEANPHRIRVLLDNLYRLATESESEKIQMVATIDYLDRMGFRMPKENLLTVQGQIVVGSPEQYRMAALALTLDKSREVELLEVDVQANPHNSDCATQSNESLPLDNQQQDDVALTIEQPIITVTPAPEKEVGWPPGEKGSV